MGGNTDHAGHHICLRTKPGSAFSENIRKKFQDDEAAAGGRGRRAGHAVTARPRSACGLSLRSQRKAVSKQIGALMAKGQKRGGRGGQGSRVTEMQASSSSTWRCSRTSYSRAKSVSGCWSYPRPLIDGSVPIGKDDSENVEIERFGEPVVPDFEVPYHVDIMERLNGIDLDARAPHQRQRLLLPQGRHRASAFVAFSPMRATS